MVMDPTRNILRELAGRVRYAGVDIEQRIRELEAPKEPKWSFPKHPDDEVAAMFGLRGFEFKVLSEEAMRALPHNAMLQELYAKFLMAAKLTMDSELNRVRNYEETQARERAKRDFSYQEKSRKYHHKVQSMRSSWSATRRSLVNRWTTLLIDLSNEYTPTKEVTDPYHAFLIEALIDRGLAEWTDKGLNTFTLVGDQNTVQTIMEIVDAIDSDPELGGIKPVAKTYKLGESA
jgi:hypothetical protein